MKRDDHILALTSGLLTVKEEAFDTVLTYFSKLYELYQPARPGFVSIAAMNPLDQPVNYVEWLQSIRTTGVTSVYFYWHLEASRHDIPPHIAAAFAGTQTLLMQVTAGKTISTYRLRTLLSPQYEITPQQFAELINAQQQKEQLWERIEELINESNGMNDRPAVPRGQVAQYLQSQEGSEVYNYMVSQLLQEVQVECEVQETPFEIPEHLQSLLYKSDFFFGDDDRIPVFLYPVNKVTVAAIRQLIAAQPFHQEVWRQFEASLQEMPLENVPSTGWPAALETVDEASLQQVGDAVCRAIVSLCEEHRVQPIIPQSLYQYFGPDELDGKRARARSLLSGKQWYLESIQQPWELYLFVQVPEQIVQLPTTGDMRQQFITQLQAIAVLAKKIQSPFTETFQICEYLLHPSLPSGHFDDEHENRIATALQEKGFSEQAVQIFRNTFFYTRDLHLPQWPAEKIYALCAVSMADVFGGMGSWNDSDPGDDAEAYQRISAGLFETMKKYFAALIST